MLYSFPHSLYKSFLGVLYQQHTHLPTLCLFADSFVPYIWSVFMPHLGLLQESSVKRQEAFSQYTIPQLELRLLLILFCLCIVCMCRCMYANKCLHVVLHHIVWVSWGQGRMCLLFCVSSALRLSHHIINKCLLRAPGIENISSSIGKLSVEESNSRWKAVWRKRARNKTHYLVYREMCTVESIKK